MISWLRARLRRRSVTTHRDRPELEGVWRAFVRESHEEAQLLPHRSDVIVWHVLLVMADELDELSGNAPRGGVRFTVPSREDIERLESRVSAARADLRRKGYQ